MEDGGVGMYAEPDGVVPVIPGTATVEEEPVFTGMYAEEEELVTVDADPDAGRSKDEDDELCTDTGKVYGKTSPLIDTSNMYTALDAQCVPHTCSGKSAVWSVTVSDVSESHGVGPVHAPISPGPPGSPPHTGPPLRVTIDISRMPPASSMRKLYLSAPYCGRGIGVTVAGEPFLLRFEDGEDEDTLEYTGVTTVNGTDT